MRLRTAELAYSPRHLRRLYDAAILLARFESVERTVPSILALASEALRVRTSLLIENRGETPRTFVWHAYGVRQAELQRTESLARRCFDYLTATAPTSKARGQRHEGNGWSTLRRPLDSLHPATDERPRTRVTLPLAVEGRPAFGLLHASCHAVLDETDVAFLDEIANQVSVALDRALPAGDAGSGSEPGPVKQALQYLTTRHGLTPTELLVAEHAIRGLSNKEIASVLGSSASTIRSHLAKIFSRLHVGSRTELTYLVCRVSHGCE